MKIAQVELFRHDFRLRTTSVVAYEAIDVAPNVMVKLTLASGLVGWGNAAPDEYVTGETAQTICETMSRVFRPFLLGRDASQIEAIWDG